MTSDEHITDDAKDAGKAAAAKAAAEEDRLARETPLLAQVRLRDQLQRLRIAEGNRASAAEKNEDSRRLKLHTEWYKRLHDLEKSVEKEFRTEVELDPAWPWLEKVKGVGPALAAQILAEVDWTRCPTVSSLWRYAGLGVVDGKRERLVKGEKRAYNGRLKVTMYRWASNQLRNTGPYAQVYRDARHRYDTTRPDWTESHRHLAALRKAEKLFLSHLWQISREARGLPTPNVYIEQYGGPSHDIVGPWEFIGETGKDKPLADPGLPA